MPSTRNERLHKTLVSAAGTRFRPLLRASLPTFERFAERHGYRLVIHEVDDRRAINDPAARKDVRWSKISVLRTILRGTDFALWIDADAMIRRYERDILDDLPGECFQGFVLERIGGRINPNSGVWVIRSDPRSFSFLATLDAIGPLDHSWSDQATICHLLGWSLGDYHGRGARPVRATAYCRGTWWLPQEWNVVSSDDEGTARIRHFAGLSIERRIEMMAAEAVNQSRGA